MLQPHEVPLCHKSWEPHLKTKFPRASRTLLSHLGHHLPFQTKDLPILQMRKLRHAAVDGRRIQTQVGCMPGLPWLPGHCPCHYRAEDLGRRASESCPSAWELHPDRSEHTEATVTCSLEAGAQAPWLWLSDKAEGTPCRFCALGKIFYWPASRDWFTASIPTSSILNISFLNIYRLGTP